MHSEDLFPNPFKEHDFHFKINASLASSENGIFSVYRTKNLFGYNSFSYLLKLNKKFEIISQIALKPSNNNTAFEDVRLFTVGERTFAFYTYLPYINGMWKWEFGVGFGTIDSEKGILTNQLSLRKYGKKGHNKNWIPYFINGELYLITDFAPYLRVLKIFNKSGNLVLSEDYISNIITDEWDYGDIRGGTPLIAPEKSRTNWRYGFIHSYLPNYKGYSRYYFYTIVRFNHITKEFNIYKAPVGEANNEFNNDDFTGLWKINTGGKLKVVFPMGIMNFEDGVVVSMGIDDVTSTLKFFKWSKIINLFKHNRKT